MNKPNVYFVGAGPGDPGLITQRGAELLGRADCVIYDGLVNPAILERCRPRAEQLCVRKRTGNQPFTQEKINQLIVQKAAEYECVVRLKGGDPGMFGRAAEEIAACLQAGIGFEIVPGVTAASAAAQYAGFFLTDRDRSSQVIFVTGREAPDKDQSAVDWDLLARFSGTIVFYMGMGNLDQIARRLLEKGKDPQTPAVVMENATLPIQRLAQGRLDTIAEICRKENIDAPAIIVIGPAAVYRKETDWFTQRPLFGKTVLITRDAEGNRAMAEQIRELGGWPVCLDSIAVRDLTDTPEAQAIVGRLGQFDWVIFTSGHGVRYTWKLLDSNNQDARAFGSAKIACIGIETARSLSQFGLRADFVPEEFVSDALADGLARSADLNGKKILLLRSAIAPDDLPNRLREHGAQVEQIFVYTVREAGPEDSAAEELIQKIKTGGIDWITFTSSSTVRSFFNQIPKEIVTQSRAKIASIGPVTSQQLRQMGVKIAVEANPHTREGLIQAIGTHYD